MQRFWEKVATGEGGLTAYNNALAIKNKNLPDAFHTYAIAAKFSKACGSGYAAPYCFEEGADYVTFMQGLPPVHGAIGANPGTFNGTIQNNCDQLGNLTHRW